MFGRKRRAAIRPTDLSAADGTTAGLITEDLLRRIERLSLTIRKPLPGGPAGEHLGRGQGASIEFADHRPYSPGDDYRRIDWNALARLDELTIRVTESREDVGLYLIIDCSSSNEMAKRTTDGSKMRYGALATVARSASRKPILAGVCDNFARPQTPARPT